MNANKFLNRTKSPRVKAYYTRIKDLFARRPLSGSYLQPKWLYSLLHLSPIA